jgi:hypothetical protein
LDDILALLYVVSFYLIDDKHVSIKSTRSIIGSLNYASIMSHKRFDLSRRDDLESLGYMLLYFLSDKLPWNNDIEEEEIIRKKTEIINKSESKNKSKVHFKFFDVELIRESAYILGLLWADGHIREEKKLTTINCSEIDINDVVSVFFKTGDWLLSETIKKTHNNKEVKNQKRISTTTWGLFEILKSYELSNELKELVFVV